MGLGRLLSLALSAGAAFGAAQGQQQVGSTDVFFAPYDASTPAPAVGGPGNLTVLQTDVALILNVTAAKIRYDRELARTGALPLQLADDPITNPFVVQFCVYNVLDSAYLNPLVAAWKAGVYVQVIMDHTNLQEAYVPTYDVFQAAGMSVAPARNTTQKDLTLAQKLSLNLIGADVGSLMHMKLRYFRWLDSPGAAPSEAVVTGSLNPEATATINDDTLVVFRGATEDIQRYRNATAAVRSFMQVLDITRASNVFDAERPVNVLFSQAAVKKGTEAKAQARRVLLDLVRNETESILISVYSLRSLDDGQGQPLVEALCTAAQQRGVAVAVVTDKGQSDGEPGFAGGDDTVTAWRLWQCDIPTYKAKNYNGRFTALHHKNAVFGVGGGNSSSSSGGRRVIVWTDTANWSKASMGNGTSDAKPSNAETSLVVDSVALDGGRTGRRFVSNFLYLLRTYAYQQNCPYFHNNKAEHANCFGDETFNQPNWTQPDARNVTASLMAAPAVAAAGGWPSVSTVFTVQAVGATAIRYAVNGGAAQTTPLHASSGAGGMESDVLTVPFGSIVDCSVVSAGAAAADVPATTTVVVDAAVDWSNSTGVGPVRRTDAELDAMAITVAL